MLDTLATKHKLQEQYESVLHLAQQRDRPPLLKQAMDDLAQLARKLVQDAAKSLCK